ncbi:hypothetical protein SPHV1_1990002 [Novosphingobium sp. KN65.2]|nr:hypothetical protein SPHV1_1990002 [Novosphingobium sp. KN65.2]
MPEGPVMWFSILTGAIWGYLKRALDIVARYPWQCALAASLCLCWVQWRGKQEALQDLATVKHAREQDRIEWQRQAEVAKAEQERVNDENEQQQAELARRADNAELEAGELRRKVDRLRAASDRFADARGMRGGGAHPT